MQRITILALAVGGLTAGSIAPVTAAAAPGTFDIVVHADQQLPAEATTIVNPLLVNDPTRALNEAGRVVFGATLSTGATALFSWQDGQLEELLRTPAPAPANGNFANVQLGIVQNDSGGVAFEAALTGTSGGTADDVGVFWIENGPVQEIVREGQLLPGTSGGWNGLGLGSPKVNDAGEVLLGLKFNDTIEADVGFFLWDGTTLSKVVRNGDPVPPNSTIFNTVYSAQGFGTFWDFNDQGELAFVANGNTVYRGLPGALTEAARSFGVEGFDLNDSGLLAFSDFFGLYTNAAGSTDVVTVAARNDPAVTAGDTFFSFEELKVASNGDIAFKAQVAVDSGGNRAALFLATGGGIIEIFRTPLFADVPAGGITTFDDFTVNALGQVIFEVNLKGLGNRGIVISDGSTLQLIAEGPVLTDFGGPRFVPGVVANDLGQVLIESTGHPIPNVAGGKNALLLYTPAVTPERVPMPPIGLLIAAGLLAACGWRHRPRQAAPR
ncbi:MAG: hypothetical protein HKO62_01915 [Gammaproteobacteria bacterium]|nr:hypothetical protein [Gammaproteobacteria bacterium]NNL99477.1 hypothetical protein [Gammaproteobacteria bacterium]